MSAGLTKKDLAALAGYSYRRLYDIDRDLPKEKKLFVLSEDGKYDLALFIQRWVAYNVANEAESSEELDVVKAQHEAVKMQKTELEVARMRGELIDVKDVRLLWGDIANTVMQNMMKLPSKVAPQLRMVESTERIAAVIEAEVRQTLEEIAETPLPDYAAETEDEESGEDD